MDIHDYLGVLRRGLLLIVLAAAVGVLGGVVAASVEKPTYSATSRELLTNKTAGDLSISQSRIASYVLVASSGLVLQPVIDQLGLDTSVDDLARQVSVVAPPETVVIEITATAASPAEAQKIANTISAVFGEVVADQLETTTGATPVTAAPTPGVSAAAAPAPAPSPSVTQLPNGTVVPVAPPTAPVRIVNLEQAALPSAPNSSSGSLMILVGGVLGLALGLVLASLREAVDRRVRSGRDVAQVTDVPVVGEVVDDGAVRATPLVARTGSRAASSEAFRALRAHVDLVRSRTDVHTYVVTAAGRGQGSTTITANLGIALANTGTSVVLVDAHVRSAALSGLFGVHAAAGLSDVLVGNASLDGVLKTRLTAGVALLPAGTTVGNPSEILATPAMRTVLAELRERFDVVLIDTPTITATTDAAVLGSFDAATLLVVEQNRTTRPRLEKALGLLAAGGSVPEGVVLNRTGSGWRLPRLWSRAAPTVAAPVAPVVQVAPALRDPSPLVEAPLPVVPPVVEAAPPVIEPVEPPEPEQTWFEQFAEAIPTPQPIPTPPSAPIPESSPIPAELLPEGQVELPIGRAAAGVFAAAPTPTAAEQRAGVRPTSRFAPDLSAYRPDSSVYAIARPPRVGTEGQVPPSFVGGTIVSTVSTTKRRGTVDTSSDKAPPPPIDHVVPTSSDSDLEPEPQLVPVVVTPPVGPLHDTAPRMRLVHDEVPVFPPHDTAPRTRPVAVPPLPSEATARVPAEHGRRAAAVGSLLGEIGGLPKVEVRAAPAGLVSDPPTEPNDRARRSYELRSRELERAAQERLIREQQRIERGIREQLAHDKRELESVLDNRLEETVVRPSQLTPRVAPSYNDDLDWDGPADS